jgi:hypothetical protein
LLFFDTTAILHDAENGIGRLHRISQTGASLPLQPRFVSFRFTPIAVDAASLKTPLILAQKTGEHDC